MQAKSRKITKKIISMILMVMMILSVCIPASAQAQEAAVAANVTEVAVGETTKLAVYGWNLMVTWTSSDEDVATVNGWGIVTGVSVGEATIKAKALSIFGITTTTEFTVSVTPVNADATIEVGETLEITVDGNETTTWTTSDEAIATVENGTVTGVSEGVATITAKTTKRTGFFWFFFWGKKTTVVETFIIEVTSSNKIYLVTFESNCEENIEDQEILNGECATEPFVQKEGYALIGWYEKETGFAELFDFGSKINRDIHLYARWFDINDTIDSDNDGLTDSLEIQFGSDPSSSDSDNDGVDDYNELNWLNTNPSSDDSNSDNSNDGEDDADEDGLTNAEESSLGTNPAFRDTDYDYLSDYDEIYIYFTDPLKADTDGDGVNDGIEINNSSDPLFFDDNFSEIVDAGEVSEDNPVSAGASVITDDDGAGTLTVEPSNGKKQGLLSSSMPGYLGTAFDFTLEGELLAATITFKYDVSLGTIGEDFQPRIYYVNEKDGILEELPDQIVEEGKITVTVEHFSTYILLNKVAFDKVWNEEIKAPDTENQTAQNLSIVFVIDDSGSMSGTNISTVKTVMQEFIENLGDEDRAAIVKFNSSASLVKGLTNDKNALISSLSNLVASGGTSISSGLSLGINQLINDTKENSYDAIILLTDGQDSSFNDSWNQYAENCKNNGIVAYSIGVGASVSSAHLTNFATGANGKYYHAEVANELEDYFAEIKSETIDYTADSNDDGISDYYTQLLSDGKLLLGDGSYLGDVIGMYGADCADWDGDGLLNGQEIEIRERGSKVYVRMYSHPLIVNSDYDDYSDYEEVVATETDPLKKTKDAGTGFNAVEELLNNEKYVYYKMATDNSVANAIAGWFDWKKTEESIAAYVNYFYDYASEETLDSSKEEREKLEKHENFFEYYDSFLNTVKLAKSCLDLSTNLGSRDQDVKAEITRYNKKHKEALEKYNNNQMSEAFEKFNDNAGDAKKIIGIFDDLSSAVDEIDKETKNGKEIYDKCVNVVSKIIPIASTVEGLIDSNKYIKFSGSANKLNQFARKYQAFLGKKVPDGFAKGMEYGTILDVGGEVLDFVGEIGDVVSLYGKIDANTDAFLQYIEVIEFIYNDSNNAKYTKIAAGEIAKIVLDESGKQYFWAVSRALGKKTIESFIEISVSIVGDFCPYVKVAETVVDTAKEIISITGMKDYAQSLVAVRAINAISIACCDLLNNLVELEDNNVSYYYSFDSANDADVTLYLTQLAQSRIHGEDLVRKYLKKDNLGNWLDDLFGGGSDEEVDDIFDDLIKHYYYTASYLHLTLSSKLPMYYIYFATPSGGGGMGGR